MSKIPGPRAISFHLRIFVALLAAAPVLLFAQDGSVGVLENPRAKRYGSGWECIPGYRKVNDACAAVKVPANGYLSDSSPAAGWGCERGYRSLNDACVAVTMPETAHLDYSGDNWKCDRPYHKQHDRCVLPRPDWTKSSRPAATAGRGMTTPVPVSPHCHVRRSLQERPVPAVG